MKFKSMLKITLSALLLLVGFSAFAEDATTEPTVTLGNNQTVTWSQFVTAINSNSFGGTADDAKLNEAIEDTVTYSQQLVQPKKAYDDAEKDLADWKEIIADSTASVTKYTNKISAISSQITNYTAQLSQINDSIAELKTTTSTVVSTPTWLKEIKDAALALQNVYANRTGSQAFYYSYTFTIGDKWSGGASTLDLTIAYKTATSPNPPSEGTWYGPISTFADITSEKAENDDFDGLFAILMAASNNMTVVSNLYVYLGSNYYDVTSEYTKDAGTNVAFGNIFKTLNSAVGTVTSDSRFQDSKTETTYDDPAAKARLDSNKKYVSGQIDTAKELSATIQGYIDAANKIIDENEGKVTAYTKTIAEGETQTRQAKLKAAYETALTNLQNARAAYNTAKAEYDEAVKDSAEEAKEAYQSITLNADVVATTAITVNYSGSIYGENHVITLSGINQLFTKDFTGTAANLAINIPANGKFASSFGKGHFENVAMLVGTAGTYYNNRGTATENLTLGQLGLAARAYFGVDFTDKQLVPLTETTKVYNITAYTSPTTTLTEYVNLVGGKFINATYQNGITIPVNTFVESATEDLYEMEALTNIIYDGKCKNAVIVDRTNFYCPKDIVAETVTYNRDVTVGYNAVCLPFDLSYDYNNENDDIKGLLTYDKADPNKFWFIVTEGTVEAYTPMLINARKAFTLTNYIGSSVTIKQTPASQLTYENRPDGTKSCGLSKKATAQQVANTGDANYKVYGLSKGVFQPSASTEDKPVDFPAFRMVIFCPTVPAEAAAMRAPRKIGILDPNGVDITDEFSGIEEVVVSEVETFSVAGGQGEIVITSAANYGKVPVYALDGKLVTVAEVAEGTTTVNVAGGMYIVMGKKVMVK